MRLAVLSVILLTGVNANAQSGVNPPATERAGSGVTLPLADEIALARTAAPPSLVANAKVMVLTDSGYAVGEAGTGTLTCVVNRSWRHSVEPHCYDEEGARSVMQVELRRNYLRHTGKSESEIAADIGQGIFAGKYRLPARPVLTYMMSSRQVLYDDNGKYVGKWRPHLMIYYPYLTPESFGFNERPEMSIGMVSEAGGPDSSLMIIMPAFADVAPARGQ